MSAADSPIFSVALNAPTSDYVVTAVNYSRLAVIMEAKANDRFRLCGRN